MAKEQGCQMKLDQENASSIMGDEESNEIRVYGHHD